MPLTKTIKQADQRDEVQQSKPFYPDVWLIAAILAVAYLVIAPPSIDLPAHVFRSELFSREGFTVFNNQWYGGHHTPAYSVLFPPLGAFLGPQLVGALSAVAATILFERLVLTHFGARAHLGAMWFAIGSATLLLNGRLTFALGVAVGLGALLAAQRDRKILTFFLSLLCAACSPVAALFLALAGIAWSLAQKALMGWIIAAIAFGSVTFLAITFPEGGRQPFSTSAFLLAITVTFAAAFLVPKTQRALRIGAALYGTALFAAYVLTTPMGSNATRLGALFAGPILTCALWKKRPIALAILTVPLLWWQWQPVVHDVRAAKTNETKSSASYYQPLINYLQKTNHQPIRVEIPLTANRWETVQMAAKFPLARGWERQLDIKYNSLFYEQQLTPTAYKNWLLSNAINYIASPKNTALDYSAKSEKKLIDSGLPYLQLVWQNQNWQVLKVVNAAPLSRGAQLTELNPQAFRLNFEKANSAVVKVHYSPYWTITSGKGCVEQTKDGWTRVRSEQAGIMQIQAHFSLERALRLHLDCGPR